MSYDTETHHQRFMLVTQCLKSVLCVCGWYARTFSAWTPSRESCIEGWRVVADLSGREQGRRLRGKQRNMDVFFDMSLDEIHAEAVQTVLEAFRAGVKAAGHG
eukprot:5821809-Amphidinium_carterae.1